MSAPAFEHVMMLQSNSAPLPDTHDGADTEGCIANISPAERRKRLTFGLIGMAVSLAVLGLMLASGLDRWWRLALFLPFIGATTGFFQWRDKT